MLRRLLLSAIPNPGTLTSFFSGLENHIRGALTATSILPPLDPKHPRAQFDEPPPLVSLKSARVVRSNNGRVLSLCNLTLIDKLLAKNGLALVDTEKLQESLVRKLGVKEVEEDTEALVGMLRTIDSLDRPLRDGSFALIAAALSVISGRGDSLLADNRVQTARFLPADDHGESLHAPSEGELLLNNRDSDRSASASAMGLSGCLSVCFPRSLSRPSGRQVRSKKSTTAFECCSKITTSARRCKTGFETTKLTLRG